MRKDSKYNTKRNHENIREQRKRRRKEREKLQKIVRKQQNGNKYVNYQEIP